MKLDHDMTESMQRSMPKAVRDYIRHLEIKLGEQDDLIRTLRMVVDRKQEEGIIIDPYAEYPIYFKPDTSIRMWVDPGKLAIDIDMRAKSTSPRVKGINVSGYGVAASGTLIIQPIASNVVHIRGAKW